MKKSFILTTLLVILTLTLQSCFEIREKLQLNRDGSGTFSLIIDMSEVKTMMEAFSGEEGDAAESPLANMEDQFSVTRERLEALEGVSNIRLTTENSGYIVTTSFDFTSVEVLNRAMNVVYEDENEYGDFTEYYKFRRRKFERTAAHNLLDQLKHELSAENMQAEGLDVSTLFADVSYVNEVEFNGRRIRKVTNEDIEIAEDDSTLTLTRFIFREGEDLSMDYRARLK